jgi:phosphopantetheine adenylyltransferase
MFSKFMSKLDSVDSVLEQFSNLRQRLEAIASRSEVRIVEIDDMIGTLEQEGLNETVVRDRALKVAKNIQKVFDV